MQKTFWLYIVIFIISVDVSLASNLELEEAQSLSNPYCIDMRIKPERDRSAPSTTSDALKILFNCKKLYQWPMSVKPDSAMIKRYGNKMKAFSNLPVLIWCTHGVRTEILQKELRSVDHNIHSIRGGTLYLTDALKLQ